VRLRPGSGRININHRTIEEFFGRETARMIVRQPLEAVQMLDRFDIDVNVAGGGTTGQAGANPPRSHASVDGVRPDVPQAAARRRLRHARRP
jgi:hypothetical protein